MAATPLRILVAHGVNLDLLGQREPEIYGRRSLLDLDEYIAQRSGAVAEIFQCPFDVECMQTNDEAQFLETISEKWDGMVLNPGAWTHTSLALADRLAALGTPFVEVHLSATQAREKMRRESLLAPHALGQVSGLGFSSYGAGLFALIEMLSSGLVGTQKAPEKKARKKPAKKKAKG